MHIAWIVDVPTIGLQLTFATVSPCHVRAHRFQVVKKEKQQAKRLAEWEANRQREWQERISYSAEQMQLTSRSVQEDREREHR